jgi:hypothetical protein
MWTQLETHDPVSGIPVRGTPLVMGASLPPPDPRESPFGEPEAVRLADAILAARPGLLIVVALD